MPKSVFQKFTNLSLFGLEKKGVTLTLLLYGWMKLDITKYILERPRARYGVLYPKKADFLTSRYICVQPTEFGSNFSFLNISLCWLITSSLWKQIGPKSTGNFFVGFFLILFVAFWICSSLKTSFLDLNRTIAYCLLVSFN